MSTGMELQLYSGNYRNMNPMFMGMNNDGSNSLYERYQKAYTAEMSSMFNNTNVNQGIANNPEAMAHLTEELEDQNGVIKRVFGFGREELPTLLNGNDPAKTVGLVRTYGEKMGDSAALIKDTESFWTLGSSENQNNENLDLITDAAIKTRDAHTAALLVMESGDGYGANTTLLNKLLVESKEQMDETEYNRFIVDTAEKFKEFSGGETMTEFLKSNYSRTGIRILGINIGGTEEEGKDYVKIINKAYKANEGTGNNYNGMNTGFGPPMAFGSSGISPCIAMMGRY